MGTVITEARVEGRISGSSVIADLLHRIRERLERNNDLRNTDSYSSYSAKITIDLSLVDVDTAKIAEQIVVGQLPPSPIMLTVTPVVASVVEERLGLVSTDTLERCVDGSIPEPRRFVQPSLEKAVDGTIPEPSAPVVQPNLEKPIVDSVAQPQPPAAALLPSPERLVDNAPQGVADGGMVRGKDSLRQVPRSYRPAPGSRTE